VCGGDFVPTSNNIFIALHIYRCVQCTTKVIGYGVFSTRPHERTTNVETFAASAKTGTIAVERRVKPRPGDRIAGFFRQRLCGTGVGYSWSGSRSDIVSRELTSPGRSIRSRLPPRNSTVPCFPEPRPKAVAALPTFFSVLFFVFYFIIFLSQLFDVRVPY